MTSRIDLEALASRVEAAEAADRGLDAEIELARGNWSPEHYEAWCRYEECGESMNPPMMGVPIGPDWFTTSIDAALQLVPEGWWHGFQTNGAGAEAYCFDHRPDEVVDGPMFEARARTPALALCAAALRARASQ